MPMSLLCKGKKGGINAFNIELTLLFHCTADLLSVLMHMKYKHIEDRCVGRLVKKMDHTSKGWIGKSIYAFAMEYYFSSGY